MLLQHETEPLPPEIIYKKTSGDCWKLETNQIKRNHRPEKNKKVPKKLS